MTDRTDEPSQDQTGTARLPNTSISPKPLVDLVARAKSEWEIANAGDARDRSGWARYFAPTLLDALEASEARIGRDNDLFTRLQGRVKALEARAEALEKELEEQIIESSESTRNWQKAEAEVAGLKARVAEVLGNLDAHLDFSIPVDAEGIVFDDTTGIDNAFRRAAELHAAVSGEGK